METFSVLLVLCAGYFTGHRWVPLTKAHDKYKSPITCVCAKYYGETNIILCLYARLEPAVYLHNWISCPLITSPTRILVYERFNTRRVTLIYHIIKHGIFSMVNHIYLPSSLQYKPHQIPSFLVLSCGCLYRIPWSQMLSREWRCIWCSADTRCSNYIWVIDNFIAN